MATELEKLLLQEKQLKEKIKLAQTKENDKQRKLDTRKKILIGAVILEKVKRGEWPEDKLQQMLDKELIHERDRVLFGLASQKQNTRRLSTDS